MSDDQDDNHKVRVSVRDRMADRYRAALQRLRAGTARHPRHAGKSVKISAAAVAREAELSRNPLYTTHREILNEITASLDRPTPSHDLSSRFTSLTAELRTLKQAARDNAREKQALATENLSLLHRARAAEDRIAGLEREIGTLRRKDAKRGRE